MMVKITNDEEQSILQKYNSRNLLEVSTELNIPPRQVRKILLDNGYTVKNTQSHDFVGKKFGHLTVKCMEKSKKGRKYFTCLCDCGSLKETSVSQSNIFSGAVRSCGCLTELSGREHSNWKGYEDISQWTYYRIKQNAEIRGLVFDLSIEFLWDLYLKQDKKCALTGRDIIFTSNPRVDLQTASLDRIDSNFGYTRNNVQWLHKDVNLMKQNLGEEYFIQTCKEIVAWVK